MKLARRPHSPPSILADLSGSGPLRFRVASLVPPATLAFLLYLLLAVAVFSSAWRNPGYLSVGDAGDPQLFMWMLGWVQYSLVHASNPLFTDFLIYPQGANLLWTLIPILPGVVLSPAMALLGPVVTFDVAMTLAIAGSAWCAYIAINSLVNDRVGAFIGGLVFGFSPYMLAHALGHINLVICLTPPLVLLILIELFVWQRKRAWITGAALGLLAVAQLLTTPEVLLTTGLIGAMAVVVAAAMKPHEVKLRMGHAVIGLIVAFAVFVPIAAPIVGFAYLGPQRVVGIVREQDVFVSDALNFVVPTRTLLLAPPSAVSLSHAWTGDEAEWNAYVGAPLLLLLLFTMVRWWSSLLVRWSAMVAALTALLSLGPHLHMGGIVHLHAPLPWLLLQNLPLVDNVLPSRLMLFFYLMAGIGLAFFTQRLRRDMRGWQARAGLIAVAASLVPLLPAVPWPTTPNPIPSFFTSGAVKRIPQGSAALIVPFSTAPGFQLGPGQDSATYPMLWQLASGMWFRMPEGSLIVPDVNGIPSGGRPPASRTQSTMIAIQQGGPAPQLTTELRSVVRADLRRWSIQTVVVGPMYNQSEMIDFFTALLGRHPEAAGGVFVWWDVGPDLVE